MSAKRKKGTPGVQTARERHLEMIRVSSMIRRIQAFALSEPDPDRTEKLDDEGARVRCKPTDPKALPCHMSGDQLKAAFKLLDKRLPDLRAIEVTERDMTERYEDLTESELQALARGINVERFIEPKTRH